MTSTYFRGIKFEEEIMNKVGSSISAYFLSDVTFFSPAIGKDSGTDILAITDKGILVIEAKNYKTMLSGNIETEKWLGTTYGNNSIIFNVYRQNKLHKRLVMNFLIDVLGTLVPVYDIIVVPDTCKIYSNFDRVMQLSDVVQWYHTLPYRKIKKEFIYKVFDVYTFRG